MTKRNTHAEARPERGTWKWFLAIVLFLATVLTYMDRQTISLCAPMISEEFNLSNEQYGELVAAFRWVYALTHLLAGYLADHAPIRPVYALAVGIWSLAGAAGAFVSNVRQLLFTRGLLGFGEAFNWPCATRIVANTLPPSDRGLASGIFNSGAAVGSLISPLIITPLAIRFGWRFAFFTIGTLGTFWIVLWLIHTRKGTAAHSAVSKATAARSEGGVPGGQSGAFRKQIRHVLLHPAFWMLVIVAATVNPGWYFLNEWIPKYMHDQRGMGYLAAGLVTVPIFVGADLGNLLSGGLIKYLTTRNWSVRKARGTTLVLTTLLIMPVALVTQLDDAYVCVALMGLAAFGITSLVANFTACQQDFSFGNVGIVAGILGMCSNVFAAMGNPLIGRYVDRSGNYTMVFVLLAVLPVISLAAILTFDTLVGGVKKADKPKK